MAKLSAQQVFEILGFLPVMVKTTPIKVGDVVDLSDWHSGELVECPKGLAVVHREIALDELHAIDRKLGWDPVVYSLGTRFFALVAE